MPLQATRPAQRPLLFDSPQMAHIVTARCNLFIDAAMKTSNCRSPGRNASSAAREPAAQLREVLSDASIREVLSDTCAEQTRTRSNGAIQFHRIDNQSARWGHAQSSAAVDLLGAMIVSLVISGVCLVRQNGRDAVLGAGEYTFYHAGRPFNVRASGEFEMLILCFPREAIAQAAGRTDVITALVYGKNSLLTALIASYLLRLSENLKDVNAAMFSRLAETAVALLAIGAAEAAKPLPRRSWTRSSILSRIKSYALERLELSSLSPARVAAEMGISIRYVHTIFSDEGTTFSNWVWSQRLEACRAKICSPAFADHSIATIAVESGFSNFSHFSRRFRQAFGLSARDMRLQALGSRLQPSDD